MNVLVVLPSVVQAIKFLQECRVKAESLKLDYQYSGSDCLRMTVGKNSIVAVSSQTVDVAFGEKFGAAYVCDCVYPGSSVILDVWDVMPQRDARVTVLRNPPKPLEVFGALSLDA